MNSGSSGKTVWYALRRAGLALGVLLAVSACASKQTPISELSAAQLWDRGVNAYSEEDWDEAIRYFDRFVLTGGSDPRVIQARYYVGQAHFEQRQYVTAASEFSRLAANLGRTELADDARFMACRSYEELSPDPQRDQEYTRAALDHCRALVEYFPDSEFVDQAGEILSRMRGKLARKVYEAGIWYLRRQAYDSALIYFDDVLESYPGTEWAPKSLLKEYEIYTILEYEEERTEVLERLLREYPDSEAAQEVGA